MIGATSLANVGASGAAAGAAVCTVEDAVCTVEIDAAVRTTPANRATTRFI